MNLDDLIIACCCLIDDLLPSVLQGQRLTTSTVASSSASVNVWMDIRIIKAIAYRHLRLAVKHTVDDDCYGREQNEDKKYWKNRPGRGLCCYCKSYQAESHHHEHD